MSKNEHSVVTSQPVNIQDMLFENTMTYIADKNRNMREKKRGLRSARCNSVRPSASPCSSRCAWKSIM